MKLVLFYLILIFLASCDKGDDPVPTDPTDPSVVVDFLDLSLTNINFTTEKDASLIVVETNSTWKATCQADWISLSTDNGNESTGFIIGASTNTKFVREATITISADDLSKEIKVTQAGVPQIIFEINNVCFTLLPVVCDTTFLMTRGGYTEKVYLDSYFISETEITNAQWRAVVGGLPNDNENSFPDLPVYDNWNNITEKFISKINDLIDYNLRLPTETEWEVAARGGKEDIGGVYAGSMYADEVAWYWNNSGRGRHDVATKNPNELGLYDMSGNVSEWCSDWYKDWNYNYIPPEESINPTGPETGTEKVIRGGDYRADQLEYDKNSCNIFYRNYLPPDIIDRESFAIPPGFTYKGYSSFPGFRLVIAQN